MSTNQEDLWSGNFGQSYTDRNSYSQEEWDAFYLENWGVVRKNMNEQVLGGLISKEAKILEVGCNTGMQLRCLKDNGYQNLYGVELQWYAVEKSREYLKEVNIVQGSGFDLPFRDGFFDVVVTNGVLIHIHPNDLARFMNELLRCSKQYVWGFEYYSENLEEVDYRGNKGYLWKADYAKIWSDHHPELKLIRQELYPYVGNNNIDCMYLLEKS